MDSKEQEQLVAILYHGGCSLQPHLPSALPQLCPKKPGPSPGAQGLPGSINVSIEILLRGPAGADPVAGVVVGEDVAADACAQANIEAAHLAQVHRIAMREENCVPSGAGDRGMGTG